jgi:hypothetical protein
LNSYNYFEDKSIFYFKNPWVIYNSGNHFQPLINKSSS